MGVFDRQIATAKRLIEKNGQTINWVQRPAGTVDPDTPWLPTVGVPVTYTPRIVFLPRSRLNYQLIRALNPNAPEVPGGTLYGLMAQVSFTPSKDDVVVRAGVEYRMIGIDPLSPNGEIILYTIDFSA